MKKFALVISILPISMLCADANRMIDTNKYDNIFNQLAQKRAGLTDDQIQAVKSPFPVFNDNRDDSRGGVNQNQEYILTGVFGDRAKINDTWYKLGDYIGNYNLRKVEARSVVLSNDAGDNIEIRLQGTKNVNISFR